MSVFIVRIPGEPRSANDSFVSEFLDKTRERSDQALIKVSVQLIRRPLYMYWINITETKMPPIYLLGFLFLGLWIWLSGFFLIFLTCFFFFTYFAFWRGFHLWAFKRGLKKIGYTGSIEILDLESGLLEVYFK